MTPQNQTLSFDDRDAWVAPEVFDVEGQKMGNAIGLHGGDEPGIMSLGTDNGLTRDELSPFVIGGQAIWKEAKVPLDHPGPSICFGREEAKPAAGRRQARHDAPKFGQDLRRIAEGFSALADLLKSL